MTELKCPYKFGYYEFEGGQDCIGTECGMHKLCGANDTLAAENDVSAASVDANDVNAMQDSREKLEADVLKYYTHTMSTLMWPDDANIKTKWVSVSMDTVLEWLDRQTAITRRETIKRQEAFCDTCESVTDEQIEGLTAERDELINAVNELQKKQPYCYDPDKPVDTLGTVGRYIDELTSELTAARNAHAQAEHEAVILREKLGRMLDNAHEITRIGGDC